MATQLLLLEDVEALGRSGEIVNVKPGYARNFLIPQGLAVLASKQALRMQERLQEERSKKAAIDKEESEAIAAKIQDISLTKVVKVDQEGHMYGSVTSTEIVQLLLDQAHVEVEKRAVQLKHPIKTTGVHEIAIKLKEGVTASFNLKVMSEEGHRAAMEEQQAS
ncbi:50S ribosomal protein L9 [Candidatus Protochlamydia phocaeensis]|uniref:50S ribosomal protein L9 n=1 Tax=Candidatus Protochlamydia phocaeensis TaxID=1414722 RepID=UPI00083801E9|nr:50S ribosomal protein L9 [Candidatus Protochlamydia phocaeensis]